MTAAVVGLFLPAACSDAGRSAQPIVTRSEVLVRIEPTSASYRPGDSVFVAIRNVGMTDVAYNLCPAERQHSANGAWTALGVTPANCPSSLTILTVGASATWFVERLSAAIGTGLYRYRFEGIVIDDGMLPEANRVSAAFRIVDGPMR